MLKSEFIAELKKLDDYYTDYGRAYPTDAEYKVIEYVYTWHPTIDNVYGKRQIAGLYFFGGMATILDMVDKATEAEDLEDELQSCYINLNQAKDKINEFNHQAFHNIPKFLQE